MEIFVGILASFSHTTCDMSGVQAASEVLRIAHVNDGAMSHFGDGFTYYFVSERCYAAFAKQQKARKTAIPISKPDMMLKQSSIPANRSTRTRARVSTKHPVSLRARTVPRNRNFG